MLESIKPTTNQYGHESIIFDVNHTWEVKLEWFEPEYWQHQDALRMAEQGRGCAWFIDIEDQHYVLRHYRRGGLMAKISNDRYLWTGIDNTRAWREWKLLAHIQTCGLPGPKPLAARVTRHGLLYSADILTHKLENTISLSSYLSSEQLTATGWQSIGICLRQFHDAHIYHADLNAHNLLLDNNKNVYIIDFDKGRVDKSDSWHRKNLKRLRRSLDKLSMQIEKFNFNDDNWSELEEGYAGETSPL